MELDAAHVPFESLRVGSSAEVEWCVSESELNTFAILSGDWNPLHVDAAFAKREGFSDRVAYGFLLGAKISMFVGMILPGRDCLLLESQIAWPRPVYPGDVVTIRGEVSELSAAQRVMKIKIRATKEIDAKPAVVGRGWTLCQSRS